MIGPGIYRMMAGILKKFCECSGKAAITINLVKIRSDRDEVYETHDVTVHAIIAFLTSICTGPKSFFLVATVMIGTERSRILSTFMTARPSQPRVRIDMKVSLSSKIHFIRLKISQCCASQ